MLFGSVALLSNAQQDTFNYNNISICESTGDSDCVSLIVTQSEVRIDLIAHTMEFIVQGEARHYILSTTYAIGGIGNNMSIFINAYREGKTYKLEICDQLMYVRSKAIDCAKIKYW